MDPRFRGDDGGSFRGDDGINDKASPNSQACLYDLGFPGTLPQLNEAAVKKAIRFGLAIHADIAKHSTFARKNYFYPDLPKGYQITQHEQPLIQHGHIDILLSSNTTKRIKIARAHLEEDSGKTYHFYTPEKMSLDFNRSGIPLLEIVSEPDLRSPEEAKIYLKTLHALVTKLGICDGHLEKGQFRADINVSIRKKGDQQLGIRTEIKNLNSFRFTAQALHYEIERQIALLTQGKTITQETRLYDARKKETRTMRLKEEQTEYRYFPEPDLLPLVIEPGWIAATERQKIALLLMQQNASI
ncbi:MAG: Asp-tRNA(Asn)/Glu-tRNA(Gln) amidotransferase subunit GatB [Gammaproteobacteria bacterium]|nr:Asp-tRNA(Asn)/Glu-tRNA(Gln) amidotransferase subunit GatB [Gammaproteobacteria bacterium]